VYGGWGEGKTSVLQLVQKRLQEERHVTVFLYAWASLNVQALFQRLVVEIARQLGLSAGDLKGLQTLRKAVTPLGPLDSRIKGPVTVLDSILGGLSSRATRVLVTKIPRALKGRKLIVFVDDIDRVRPGLVPELLLSLREVLNQPDYFYIIALAPDVVQASLRTSNKEWGDTTKFLEKIIELPRQLPWITDDDLGRFLEASCNRLAIDHAHRQYLLELGKLLPRNPRQLKTFLRFVGSLGHLIARFDTEEVDWSAFYVAQLLRLEFPSESSRLANDANAMHDLTRDILRDHHGTKPDGKSHPFERHAPQEGKERFNELCERLAGRPLIFGLYDLRVLFYLLDEPPLITWKEIRSFIDRYSCTPGTERLNLLAHRVAESGERSKGLKALYHRALEFRGSALAAAIDCVTKEDLRERLDNIGIIDDILLKLELDLHGVADGILRDESLDALTTQCVKWAAFQDPPYYDKARVSERRLLGAFLDSVPDARLLELPALMGRWAQRVELADGKAPLKELITEKATEVRRRLARVFLTSFRDHVMLAARPTLVSDATNHAYRMVFYEPDSPLLAEPELRAEFLRVLAESGAAIQENAVEFLRSLVWGRRQDILEASKFAAIVGDREIMQATWAAAVRQPLQERYAGHLQEVRKQLIEAQVPEDLLPLPRWLALERGDPRDQDPRQ
jgi:hypothetical protein